VLVASGGAALRLGVEVCRSLVTRLVRRSSGALHGRESRRVAGRERFSRGLVDARLIVVERVTTRMLGRHVAVAIGVVVERGAALGTGESVGGHARLLGCAHTVESETWRDGCDAASGVARD